MSQFTDELPITLEDIKNSYKNLDPSHCVPHDEVNYEPNGTYSVSPAHIDYMPNSKNSATGCYISQKDNQNDDYDTLIDVSGSDNRRIYHVKNIRHLRDNPTEKLMRYIGYSFVTTLTIAIIGCNIIFWISRSNCIEVESNNCNSSIGNNKVEKAKLINFLFPTKLWNWPYNKCDDEFKGGSPVGIKIEIDDDDTNESCKININNISNSDESAFPYSILNTIEEMLPNSPILKIIPKYSVYLILFTMLIYRLITVKIITTIGYVYNNYLKNNIILKLLAFLFLAIALMPMLSFIFSSIIPFLSIIFFITILGIHLFDLHKIVSSNITQFTNNIY